MLVSPRTFLWSKVMLLNAFRFFRGIFGYSSAKHRQDELKKDLRNELKMQRALAENAGHELSRLQRELRAAEQEARD
jgi:hypothetical protein